MFEIPSLSENFLSHGSNINSKNFYGRTSIHTSAYKNIIDD